MKKIIAMALAAGMALSLVACGTKAPSQIKIGIVQLGEHAALDAANKGFVDGLKELGYEDGKNIKIDFQNAQGEQANCVTIADKFVNDKCNLILAIATPAAQAVANKTKDIPILVTAVTDPADAKLVASNTAPGGNVTGTSDLNPIKQQVELLMKLAPTVKKVGFLYCSSEANSLFQVNLARAELEALGIEATDFTVSSSNELQQVAQSMVGKVDAIYIPTDNMLSAGMVTVAAVANAAKLPVIVGEGEQVKNGGLATYGINYYNLGKQTAAMAVKILKDGAKPAEMPIEYLEQTDLAINVTTAKAIGVTIPQELLDKVEIFE